MAFKCGIQIFAELKTVHCFAGNIRGYEHIWILGDDFVARTAGPHFQHNYETKQKLGYIRAHYDTTIICSGTTSRDLMEDNILGRIHNNYVQAVEDQVLLPKAVIIVLEDDMIKTANHFKKGSSTIFDNWLKWITNDLFKITAAYKEKLPTKSRKFKYPHSFWVPAAHHDDFG